MLAMTKDMTVMAVVTMGQSFDGPSDDDAKELKVMTITPVSVTASATSTVVSSIVGGQLYAGQNASEVTSFVTVSGSTKHHAVSTSTTDDDSWAASCARRIIVDMNFADDR